MISGEPNDCFEVVLGYLTYYPRAEGVALLNNSRHANSVIITVKYLYSTKMFYSKF